MNFINKYSGVIAVVAIVLAIYSFSSLHSGNLLGSASPGEGVTNLEQLDLSQGLTVGNNGTTIANLNAGLCYIDPYAATIAATTTVAVDCQGTLAANASGSSALPGILVGDNVQATLSTTTAGTTVGGLVITGASASTTAGHIELKVMNLTGTTYTWSTTLGTASGTASYITNR